MLKNNTAIVSAMEAQDVGCPDLALLVDSTEWILNLVAMSFNMSWFSWERAILIFYDVDVLFMLQPRLELTKLGLEN